MEIYIVGGEGSWSLEQPLGKMKNMGDGNYVDTLTIAAPIYFVFADGSPEQWNNDWTAFNANYRYGPSATVTISTGNSYTTAKRNNNYSYYFTGDGSDYLFSFNVDDLTFKVEKIEEPQVTPLYGDVNDDGVVNISDVTLLIDYVLNNGAILINEVNSDMNSDHVINITDITLLIDYILGA